MAINKKAESNKCWWRGEKKELLCTEEARNNKCWFGSGGKGNLVCCLLGINHYRPYEIAYRFLKKLQTELPWDPAISLLATDIKRKWNHDLRVIYNPIFTAALITITGVWKHPKCLPVCQQMNSSREFIHAHTVKYSSIFKKMEILSFSATWVNLEGIMISGISHYRKTNTAWTHRRNPPTKKKKKKRVWESLNS